MELINIRKLDELFNKRDSSRINYNEDDIKSENDRLEAEYEKYPTLKRCNNFIDYILDAFTYLELILTIVIMIYTPIIAIFSFCWGINLAVKLCGGN